ncbi:MAG: hypothetical protein KAS53_03410 [Candidatus Cloacimonetes bacterium]|nr:hypothetical protein [Candidatus Cloacimonadota bacterium]
MKKTFILILLIIVTFTTNSFAQQLKKIEENETEVEEKKIKEVEKKTEQPKMKEVQKKEKQEMIRTKPKKVSKKPRNISNYNYNKPAQTTTTKINKSKLQKVKRTKHKPYTKKDFTQNVFYHKPIKYHYTIPPRYIYRGIWIRYYFVFDNGFYFFNGYPYFVYHNHLHRYSYTDPGSYDLVDSVTDKVYATFYGFSLKQSYDRCAQLRDRLNREEGFYRYFCAERFEYDSDYNYGWDPDDYSDWYWD